MWPFTPRTPKSPTAPLFFTNTLSGQKEIFAPLESSRVTMYSCGPTVYSKQHIGNMRPAVFSDTIARVLSQAGYQVRRVTNVTDVGHLVSDGDEGEDKVELGAKREGKTAQELADLYTKLYLDDVKALGIDTDDILFPRATAYVKEQIALIQQLEQKGFTYRTHDGLYFDTSKFPGYGKLGQIPASFIKEGDVSSLPDRLSLAGKSRIGDNPEKRNPADFALWKFSPVGVVRLQEWPSPWGRGFPGWHVECSAMAKALLGVTIDIHTGGIDHIPVHHNNEIAQSEAASERPLARYWMHEAFLTIEGRKISKSAGDDTYVSDIVERGYHPLALRYLFLQAHYRSPLSFSWEALAAANEALLRLWRHAAEVKQLAKGVAAPSDIRERIVAILRDDLSTPQALALLWETVKDDGLPAKAVWGVIEAADQVLGLSLTHPPALRTEPVPTEITKLAQEREEARTARDFARADELRVHIEERGYHVDDTPSGPVLTKNPK